MTAKLLLILSIFSIEIGAVYGQKENNVWAFGNGAGLDFNGPGNPKAIVTAIKHGGGTASVADPRTGKLLFYTDGNKVWNAQNQIMPNSPLNIYTQSSYQGALIAPVVDAPGKYYIFSLDSAMTGFDASQSVGKGKLYYSVVDMSLNGGLGDVVTGQKRQFLIDSVSEAMVAIPGNQCDIWLLVHARYGNVFHAFNITASGINPIPVSSPVGPTSSGFFNVGGMIHASLSGEKIIFHSPRNVINVITENNRLAVFDFDKTTGKVLNPLVIPVLRVFNNTVLSPDHTKLYATANNFSALFSNSILFQYDLSSGVPATIAASEVEIATVIFAFTTMQRGPDGKIYVSAHANTSISTNTALSRIEFPELAGTACNYVRNIIPLVPGTNCSFGFPNIVPFIKPRDLGATKLDTLVCDYPALLKAPPGFPYQTWQDSSIGNSHSIDSPGMYWVISANDNCEMRTDSFEVSGTAELHFSIGADTLLVFCDHPLSYIDLEAPIPEAKYRWQDGSSHKSYRVKTPGTYWVELTKEGCVQADTMYVAGVMLDLGPDLTLCKGDPIDFTFRLPLLPSNAFVQWSDGSAGSSLHVTDTGVYQVNIIQPPCLLTDSIRVRRELCSCFTDVPNAFSPNGDGINDVFLPIIEAGCPIGRYMFQIFNRFGERVFYSVEAAKGWDGSYKGQPADAGTYFFELRYTGTKEKAFYKKGDLILIR